MHYTLGLTNRIWIRYSYVTQRALRKYILTIGFIFITLLGAAQEIERYDTAQIDAIITANNFYEDYKVGANDSLSIGVLKTILINAKDKFTYEKINPKISELYVTGTASPFRERVPFKTWIEDCIHTNDYNSHYSMGYRLERRQDGMDIEYLVVRNNVNKDKSYPVRTIIIHRLEGSIISIWDSILN